LRVSVDALLRRHLQRLRRLSRPGITRYKAYSADMARTLSASRERALAANREVFADAENRRAIERFARQGLFPWDP
jgi:polyketide biosynthesis enoyl-CoA hydratase PksH